MDSTKPKAVVGKVAHIEDGQRFRSHLRRNGKMVGYIICCDCGLTHLEEITVRKRYLSSRVWRDDKLTKKYRGKRVIRK